MFALRHWRFNTFGDGFLRVSRTSVNAAAGRQLAESSTCPLYVNARRRQFGRRSYTNFAAFKCWNCQTVVNNTAVPCLFCKNCSFIQPYDQQDFNYFELFNIPEQYDVDTQRLTSNFRQLQNLVHPDKFSNKSKVTFTSLLLAPDLVLNYAQCFRRKRYYRNHFLPF